MPLIATLGNASAKAFGFGSVSLDPYFVGRWTQLARSVFDSTGKDFWLSKSIDSGITLAKCTYQGPITTWGRDFTRSGWSVQFLGFNPSSNGSHLVSSGSTVQGGSTFDGPYALLLNGANGSVQWQRKLSSYPSRATVQAAAVDNSGDCYICAESGSFTYVTKITAAGSLAWTRRLLPQGTNVSARPTGCAVDNAGFVYVAMRQVPQNGTGPLLIAKIATSDGSVSVSWSVGSRCSESAPGTGTAVFQDGNLYIQHPILTPDSFRAQQVTKISSAGTLAWAVYLQGSEANLAAYSVCADADGNAVCVGEVNTPTNKRGWWQKLASANGGEVASGSITATPNTESGFGGVYANSTHIKILPSGNPLLDYHSFPADGSRKKTVTMSGLSVVYGSTGIPSLSTAATSASTYTWSQSATFSLGLSASGDLSTATSSLGSATDIVPI
jgi:hypothetical protein